ncbi:hypothetical protein OVA24_01605 [Luteolibacter sp. SL250]|uniref:hypothetical protein n=1 Tax=Luteolibacter sp. SL250 TaxID=2995170 RepID=UPI00226FD3AF|nr:hypothetical protein [Luteolibacter sp. SL250]WAC20072.1 hypothetical protein OVA24_01605 [Luteolibacter sp. SL250]
MKNLPLGVLRVFALAAFLPASASAAIVAHYTFTNGSFASTAFAGYSATTITETGFTSVNTSTNVPGNGAARAITLDQIGTTFGPDYYEFTVNTNPTGGTLSLGQLRFAYNASGGGTGVPSSYQVHYNDLSGTAGFQNIYTSAVTQGTTDLTALVDLSGAAFQNLTSGITFRIYVADTGNDNNGVSVRIDDIIVDTVPEPGAALLGLASLGGFLVRRRR